MQISLHLRWVFLSALLLSLASVPARVTAAPNTAVIYPNEAAWDAARIAFLQTTPNTCPIGGGSCGGTLTFQASPSLCSGLVSGFDNALFFCDHLEARPLCYSPAAGGATFDCDGTPGDDYPSNCATQNTCPIDGVLIRPRNAVTLCPDGYLVQGASCVLIDPCDPDSPGFNYFEVDWAACDVPTADPIDDQPLAGCDQATDPYSCQGPPSADECDPELDPFSCLPPDPQDDPNTPENEQRCPSGYSRGEFNGAQICAPLYGDSGCASGQFRDGEGQCSSTPQVSSSRSSTSTSSTTSTTTTTVNNPDGSVTTTSTTTGSQTEERQEVVRQAPDAFEGEGRSIADAFDDYAARMQAVPVVNAVSTFFDVSLSSGSCPVYSGNVPGFGVLTVDQWCDPAMLDIWDFIAAVILAVAVLVGVRIAFG